MGKIKEILQGLNEHVFNIVILVFSLVATWLSYAYDIQALEILSLTLLRVSLFLLIGSGFITFLNGVGCDIKKEIFEENSVAAAVLLAGFWIGLAVAISVSI